MSTDDEILTTDETAKELRKSPQFVLREIQRNNLRAIRYGGRWHVTRGDLRKYIDANANVRPVR